MDIVVLHPRLESKGGGERWSLKMAQHYHAPIYCLSYNPDETFEEFKKLDVRIIPAPLLKPLFFLPKKIRESIAYSVALALFKLPTDKPGTFGIYTPPTKTVVCCTPPAELAAIRNNLVWYCQSPNRLAFDSYRDKMVKESLFKRALFALTVPFFRVLDKFAVSMAAKVFANSENIKKRLKQYMNVDAEVLYQGVNIDEFYCEKFEPLFLYPSRITRSKRFEIAIDAYAKLDEKLPGRSSFVIAGFLDHDNLDDMKYFEEISERAGHARGIVINTMVSDEQMKKLYATCLCTIYTPKNEDFGLVPIEAAASSKPCIGINEGGLKETIIDGGTGFLVDNSDELAEKMELMLKTPGLAESLGKRARLVCKDKFSWERFFERFDQSLE
jgi:glycosyltransferase involved in cell wall biosynthesis